MWGLSDTSTLYKSHPARQPCCWQTVRSIDEAAFSAVGSVNISLSINHVFESEGGMTYPLKTDFQVGG